MYHFTWDTHNYLMLVFYDAWKLHPHTTDKCKQNYNALHTQCFFDGQKSTGVSQHLLGGKYSCSSLPSPISDFISTAPTKPMVPAFSTMHEEKWKALSHLNCKHSESLEEDKANIKNHKKYAHSTLEFLLHTDAHLIFL